MRLPKARLGTGVFVALLLSVWLWRVKSQPVYQGQSRCKLRNEVVSQAMVGVQFAPELWVVDEDYDEAVRFGSNSAGGWGGVGRFQPFLRMASVAQASLRDARVLS